MLPSNPSWCLSLVHKKWLKGDVACKLGLGPLTGTSIVCVVFKRFSPVELVSSLSILSAQLGIQILVSQTILVGHANNILLYLSGISLFAHSLARFSLRGQPGMTFKPTFSLAVLLELRTISFWLSTPTIETNSDKMPIESLD